MPSTNHRIISMTNQKPRHLAKRKILDYHNSMMLKSWPNCVPLFQRLILLSFTQRLKRLVKGRPLLSVHGTRLTFSVHPAPYTSQETIPTKVASPSSKWISPTNLAKNSSSMRSWSWKNQHTRISWITLIPSLSRMNSGLWWNTWKVVHWRMSLTITPSLSPRLRRFASRPWRDYNIFIQDRLFTEISSRITSCWMRKVVSRSVSLFLF